MSEETTNLVPGETETLTGQGTVTTDGDIQSTVTNDPTVPADAIPTVDPAGPSTDPVAAPVPVDPAPAGETVPTVDPAATDPVAAPADPTPVVDHTDPTPVVAVDSTASTSVIMYNGKQVMKRFGLFDAEGSEECELADGTTAFVPKSVLGA